MTNHQRAQMKLKKFEPTTSWKGGKREWTREIK